MSRISMFDDHELTIPCAHCGHKTRKSIGWLRNHREFICRCGVVTFRADEVIDGINEADKLLDKFGRDISRKFP